MAVSDLFASMLAQFISLYCLVGFSQQSKSSVINGAASQKRSALLQVQQSQKQTTEIKAAPLNDRLLQSTDKNRRPLVDTFTAPKPNYMQMTRAFSHRQLNPARLVCFIWSAGFCTVLWCLVTFRFLYVDCTVELLVGANSLLFASRI
jgi:hypothetical protein